MSLDVLKEAKRLYDLGFAIHWLHTKSKRPVESKWTTGPRKPWIDLARSFKAGYNVGVRLGTPSLIRGGYLAVIDVDVKSTDPKHAREALEAAEKIMGGEVQTPSVTSGRGNGSSHYYVLTRTAFKPFDAAKSTEVVTVHMPSATPSKKEKETLTPDQIQNGVRLRKAWEVSIMSEGRQVVLPPSIHPDSGLEYAWWSGIDDADSLAMLDIDAPESPATNKNNDFVSDDFGGIASSHPIDRVLNQDFTETWDLSPVDLEWLPVSNDVRAAILTGDGVTDRSGYLPRAAHALFTAGLTTGEVLSVLTDPDTFLGTCAYEHAQTVIRERAARWLYKYTVQKVESARDAARIFGVDAGVNGVVNGRLLSEKEIEVQTAEFMEGYDWRRRLIRGGQYGSGPIKNLMHNVVLILKNEVSETLVRRDLFAYRDAYEAATPWGGVRNGLVSDDDVYRIKFWLSQNFNFEPSTSTIFEALAVMACENAYDPVVDYLNGLPEWDGVARLDTWLKIHFGAEGDDEYLAQVFRKWMVAMVMRAYHPGAKFDWMPIFEGAQGVGKSSFGRLLVGGAYFLDWLPNLNDKDSALALQGAWSVELGELSQFRKNELESIKAFMTRTVDKVRPPFGKKTIESFRRCVFFGTTNRSTYLSDDTGNRRFKPVVVGQLDFDALIRDRDQLFAEARHLWFEKKETELTLDLIGQARVTEHQLHDEKRLEDDSDIFRDLMHDFIQKVEAGEVIFKLDRFRIIDLFDAPGPFTNWKKETRNFMFVSKMLKREGMHSRRSNGFRLWSNCNFGPTLV